MKKITILLLAVATLGAGCKKFTDINNNPNQPTVVTPNVVLSAALSGSAAQLAGGFPNTPRWMASFSRSGNFIQTIPVETYAIAPDYADGDWQQLYRVLGRYDYIEHNSNGDPFYVGVGKTMKALHFSTLIDAFGNVPYTQAFNLAKFPTPKYDDAATIYKDLLHQLDSAALEFNLAKQFYHITSGTVRTNDDKYDIMFGRGAGGADEAAADARLLVWIRFANTVKLRLLMTISDVAPTIGVDIHAELAKITQNGQGYITAGQSAAVNPGYSNSSAAQQNPFYGAFINTSGNPTNTSSFNRANQYFINFGHNTGDDRYTDVYAAVSGNYVGNYDGDPNSQPNTFTSAIGPGVLASGTQDELILSDFESLFWQAEAVQKGFTEVSTLSVANLAKAGTEQSYVYLNDQGAPADDIAAADAFLSGDAGDSKTDVAVGGLQAVMTLKWAALICINWEQSYTDYRRTGYPTPDGVNFGFSHANNVVTHNGKVQLPYRYLYPQSEINTNSKNIPAGITAYTKIFWDKNTTTEN